MITIRLMGGLGNQLFQVSAMLFARSRLHRRARCETSWFDHDVADRVETTTRDLEVGRLLSRADRYRLPAAVARAAYAEKNPLLRVDHGANDDVFGRLPHGPSWIVGYHQKAEYPLSVRDELAVRFHDAFASMARTPAPTDVIGLHIRLGDYATDPNATGVMGLTGVEYYVDAINTLRADIGDRPARVFTDSPELFQATYADRIPGEVTVSGTTGAWETLREMSACSALVMSNSSLSWWSAFVATILEQRPIPVVMPIPWFASASPADELMHVTGWRRIPRPLAEPGSTFPGHPQGG